MDRRRHAPPAYTEATTSAFPEPNAWIGQQVEFYSDAYTRKERINLAVCSFNVDSRKATADLTAWLRLQNNPSVIAIGLQEVDMTANALLRGETEALQVWKELLCNAVRADCDWSPNGSKTGAPYTMIGIRQMVGLLLVVFVAKPLLQYTTGVRMSTITTGAMMGTLGNKGAIALRLRIHRTRIVFVTVHLAAHMHEVDRRNRDFDTIMGSLSFTKDDLVGLSSRGQTPGINAGFGNSISAYEHDYVFVFGDLNYRIDRYSYDQVVSLVKDQSYNVLLKEDQLRREFNKGTHYKGFQEAEQFTFAPTYRYDEGTCNFDTSEKRRVPAYTDRVIWWLRPVHNVPADRLKENVILKNLTSFPEICSSDHKPLSALFEIALHVEVEAERTKIMSELLNRVSDTGFERIITPQIEVSVKNISFGICPFGTCVERSIALENKGLSVTEFGVYVNNPSSNSRSSQMNGSGNKVHVPSTSLEGRSPEAVCAISNVSWVGVTPLEQFVFPGDFVLLTVECRVERNAMSFQELKMPFCGIELFLLQQTIVIQPRYGLPILLNVDVLVPPSSFGNTLCNLISMGPTFPCIEAYAQKGKPADSQKSCNDPLPCVAKEIWALVDVIYRKHAKTPSLFLEDDDEDQFDLLRTFLDNQLRSAESIVELEKFGPHTVANGLTALLQSLQTPVVPFELYYSVATATAPKHYFAILEDMRSIHYNIFMYLISLLRFLLREENQSSNGLSVEALAAGFGPVLMQAPHARHPLYRTYTSDEQRTVTINVTGFLTWCLTADSLIDAVAT